MLLNNFALELNKIISVSSFIEHSGLLEIENKK